PPQQLDRVLRPVGGKDVGAATRSGERRQPEAAAELQDPQPAELARREVACQSETAGPELRPVRQELLFVERRLVHQLLRARRPEDLDAQVGRELDVLLDEWGRQSAAKRSTPTPSGSVSCAERWPQKASHGAFSP